MADLFLMLPLSLIRIARLYIYLSLGREGGMTLSPIRASFCPCVSLSLICACSIGLAQQREVPTKVVEAEAAAAAAQAGRDGRMQAARSAEEHPRTRGYQ